MDLKRKDSTSLKRACRDFISTYEWGKDTREKAIKITDYAIGLMAHEKYQLHVWINLNEIQRIFDVSDEQIKDIISMIDASKILEIDDILEAGKSRTKMILKNSLFEIPF